MLGKEIIPLLKTEWGIKPDPDTKVLYKSMRAKGFVIYKDDDYYYLSRFIRKGKKIFQPRFGDYRIKYSYIPDKINLSVIGEQKNGKIVPYRNKIFLVAEDIKTPEEMINKYELESRDGSMWIKRFVCGLGFASSAFFAFRGW